MANHVPESGFSWLVFLTLLSVLGLSAAMFAMLVRRWTTQRGRLILSDWCKGKAFRIGNPEQAPALSGDLKAPLRPVTWLWGDQTHLLSLEQVGAAAQRWHALLRALPIDAEWKPTGLRPAHARESLLDLYSLSSYPALGNVERFVVFGTDTSAARMLSRSQFRGLLPPDVGLLIVGTSLILDFSSRPFDPLEFERMLALADQLVAHLPVPR